VENVLDLLRDGLGSTLIGLGHSSIDELRRDDLVMPPGFERRLGIEGPDTPVDARSAAGARST
jgi:pre-mycofactocin synthase